MEAPGEPHGRLKVEAGGGHRGPRGEEEKETKVPSQTLLWTQEERADEREMETKGQQREVNKFASKNLGEGNMALPGQPHEWVNGEE